MTQQPLWNDPDELVTYRDIEIITGQKIRTIRAWYERRDDTGFPEPVQGKGTIREPFLFDIEQVEHWWHCWTFTRRGHYGKRAKG